MALGETLLCCALSCNVETTWTLIRCVVFYYRDKKNVVLKSVSFLSVLVSDLRRFSKERLKLETCFSEYFNTT